MTPFGKIKKTCWNVQHAKNCYQLLKFDLIGRLINPIRIRIDYKVDFYFDVVRNPFKMMHPAKELRKAFPINTVFLGLEVLLFQLFFGAFSPC